jgi:hypothetical protein
MGDQLLDKSLKLDMESSEQNPLDRMPPKEIDMCTSTELVAMLEASEKQLQIKAYLLL